jgi:DNA polymerase III delta subunit
VIYFYHGENEFALQRQIDAVTVKFGEQHGAEAITYLDASETEPQNLLAEIVNINMFAPRRLIIIKNASKSKVTWEMLGENLTRVPDETELIIVTTKPDKRTKTYKDLLKSTKSREFLNLDPREIKSWLSSEARGAELKIEPAAIDELLVITGGDNNQQARLATEIAKFQTLGRPVDVELVRQIVEPNLATNAFDILRLAITSNRQAVSSELKQLRESGEDANKFFGLLASQIFALAAAVFAGTGSETVRNLKIHPFQLAKMRDLAEELGDTTTRKQRVKKITQIFADVDAKAKLSRADEAWILIETALAKIIS